MSEWRVNVLNADVTYVSVGTEKTISGGAGTEKTISSESPTEKTISSISPTEKTIASISTTEKTTSGQFFENGYSFRRSITIDNTKVSGSTDFTDFAVLVQETGNYLKTVGNGGDITNINGWDIIFTSDILGASQLDHEIHKYDGANGIYIAWVRVPTLGATADTVIYMFYGNSSIGSTTENVNSVWSSNYEAVWHLQEESLAVSGEHVDSTGNGNDATGDSTNAPALSTSGKFGNAQNFVTANDEFIEATDINPLTQISFSAWVNPNASPASVNRAIMCKFGNWNLFYDFQPAARNGHAAVKDSGGTFYATGPFSPEPVGGAWILVHGVYDQSKLYYYIDGAEKSANAIGDVSPLFDDTVKVTIGRRDSGATATTFDGLLQEARILNTGLSADWVATEYNSQNSPSTFYTLSSADSGTMEKEIN